MNSDSTEGSGMIEALAWLEVNKKRLAVGAIVLLVAGFAMYVYNHAAKQKEAVASAALISLRPPASTNEPPIPASEFLKIAEQYAGTAAAQRAILLAASALFAEGKFADAHAQFDRLLKEHPSSAWAADAAYGMAASLESQGKPDEALTGYQRVLTGYASSPVVSDARMALARIYEAKNQPAEALKQYDDLTRADVMTMRAQDAVMRRSQLLKKHPELDKPATNAPTALAPITLMPGTNKTAPAIASTNLSSVTNRPASATNTPAAGPKK